MKSAVYSQHAVHEMALFDYPQYIDLEFEILAEAMCEKFGPNVSDVEEFVFESNYPGLWLLRRVGYV